MADDAGDDGTVTWRALVAEARERLARARFENPGADARWIVERASGFEGAEYVTGLDEKATERGVHFFDVMLGRRLAGEPLQYVLGRWAFRTLDLFVDPRVLIPRPETEVVVGHALDEIDRLAGAGARGTVLRVADLGTGSGAIALSIAAERSRVEVWASDISPDALDVARANLAGIGPGATRVTIVEGSWFEALPVELAGHLAVVVANPPYVAANEDLPAEVVGWEPHRALISGPTGLEALGEIASGAPRWLEPSGALVVELAPGQAAPLGDIARSAGFAEVEIRSDLAGRERVLIARLAGR